MLLGFLTFVVYLVMTDFVWLVRILVNALSLKQQYVANFLPLTNRICCGGPKSSAAYLLCSVES